jgi:hypothetical protein
MLQAPRQGEQLVVAVELAAFMHGICEAKGAIGTGQVGVRGGKDESK